jgi:hypothetical protein
LLKEPEIRRVLRTIKVVIIHDFGNSVTPFFDRHLPMIRKQHTSILDGNIRITGYRSGGPGSIPGTTRKKSSASRTGSTQPREYNRGAT